MKYISTLFAAVLLFAASAAAHAEVNPAGWWSDPEHDGAGLVISQDSGFGHGVLWFLHRVNGSSAFLIAGENCEEFPCVTTLHEPTAAWMGGATSQPGPEFDLGDPIGSLEMSFREDGSLAVKFNLYNWREDCRGLGAGGAIFRACVGNLNYKLLAR